MSLKMARNTLIVSLVDLESKPGILAMAFIITVDRSFPCGPKTGNGSQ